MELKPETRAGPVPNFFAAHAVGLVALLIGVVGFSVVAFTQEKLWMQPDLHVALPFFIAAIAAGVVSLARKEGALYLPLLGVGLAGAAMVLGFVIIFGAVVLATLIVIVILHGVM
jgi:hypothetical protein